MIGLLEQNGVLRKPVWLVLCLHMCGVSLSCSLFGRFDVFELLCKNDCLKKLYFLYFSNWKHNDYIIIVQPDKNKRKFNWLISGPSKAVLDRQKGVLDREIEGLLQSTNKKDDKKF